MDETPGGARDAGGEPLLDLAAPASVAAVAAALECDGYLLDEGLATVLYLALSLRRPVMLEGEPGVGKTEVARSLARVGGTRLIRLQCHEGIDAAQAVYEWDYARQLLHLRSAEATGELRGRGAEAVEAELYDERFLIRRPLLEALSAPADSRPPVLLVDEVDRADDDFDALLLEVLADHAVTIPEIGTVQALLPPVVVLTSNRTRDVHDALKRRCLYHWVEHPDFEREVAIVARKAPAASDATARAVAGVVGRFRELGLYKPPGVAESIDWATALSALGADGLTVELMSSTLGAVLKYREDEERVRRAGLADLLTGVPAR